MRRITVATIVASSLALAACAERDSTSPRAISSGGANFAGRGGSSPCNFSTVNSTARSYFTSNQDPVLGMIDIMQNAYNTNSGGGVAATPEGWVILSRVADQRLRSVTTTGQAGAAFVVAVAGCMADLTDNTSPLALPAALTANSNALLARVLNSGIWEIRTGGTTGAPAAGKNMFGGARTLGSPVWGVETQTTSSTWPGALNLKYAVVGYPIQDNNLLLQSPPQIDANDDLGANSTSPYQVAGTWPFNGFELLTIPTAAVSDHSTLRVGICVTGNPGGDGTVNFLVHNDAELVPNSTPAQLCATGFTGSIGTALPWYTRLARGAAGFFKPGVLFAQGGDDDGRGFIGGLPSGWSPITGGLLQASQVTVTLSTQPKNNLANFADNSLVITTTITGTTTPVPQVRLVGISVLNNSGAPAGAVIVDGSTNLTNPTLVTDALGHATLHFALGKPGAYYIVVSTQLDGQAFPDVQSIKFNVKNH